LRFGERLAFCRKRGMGWLKIRKDKVLGERLGKRLGERKGGRLGESSDEGLVSL
jgi:hypothetical protein